MRLTACLAAAALLLAPSARAVPVQLYEASAPVADQTPETRDPALRRALQIVLFRVTGTHLLPPEAETNLLPRASTLVQSYGYETPASGQGLLLHARFDARAVNAALRTQNLPVWGANRPSHVVWIALRDDGQPRAVLDAAGIANRAATVAAVADARGLPFTFPAADELASFNQVWAGNFPGIENASRRYNADIIVVGRVGKENGRWLGRWALINSAGGIEEWVGNADSLNQVLAAGIDELADREVQRFGSQGNTAQELHLRVSGVDSLDAYGRVLGYLRGLNTVRSTQVESAEGDRLTLRLHVEGDPATVARLIGSGNVLREQAEGQAGLSYVLVR